MREIRIGELVSFVTVDHGVEISVPSGTLTTQQTDRLVEGRHCWPWASEIGLVVEGSEWNRGGNIELWRVYVGEANWWFPADHLIPANVQ